MPRRPCLGGPTTCPALAEPGKPRCTECERYRQRIRNATRPHYAGDYDTRAAAVRSTAQRCWLCGEGPRPGDPWTADHVDAGNPASELRPAHRSCNASRGNREIPTTR